MDYISPRHQTRLADEHARAHIHLQRQRECEEEGAWRQLAKADACHVAADVTCGLRVLLGTAIALL
jgi:hypothetical protein